MGGDPKIPSSSRPGRGEGPIFIKYIESLPTQKQAVESKKISKTSKLNKMEEC